MPDCMSLVAKTSPCVGALKDAAVGIDDLALEDCTDEHERAPQPAADVEAFDWFGAVDEDIVVQVVLHVGGADLGRLECVCGLFGRRGESGQTLCERVAVLRTEDHPNRAYCAPRRGETAKQLLHATEACAYGARAVASARHTVAVSADQVLMSCGNGDAGRLGQGVLLEGVATLQRAPLTGVVQVAAGVSHNAALDVSGNVWSFGWGESGRLGHGSHEDELVPRVVDSLRDIRVRIVSAGCAHTAAVSINGAVFTWGAGDNGQLGHGDQWRSTALTTPRRVDFIGPQSMISCGGASTSSVSVQGELFCWGQLVETAMPTLLASPAAATPHSRAPLSVATAACGGGLSSGEVDFLAALGVSGELLTLGHSVCGIFDDSQDDGEEALRRWPGQAEAFSKVDCGAAHAACISSSGQLFTWGRAKHGRLGQGDRESRSEPTLVEAFAGATVVEVSCGREHTIVGLSNGDVYTFGCGDDGRLGHGNGHRQSLPRRIRGMKLHPAPSMRRDTPSWAGLPLADGDFEDVV